MIVPKRGALIVIEGGDGTGKATQVSQLHKNLILNGYHSKTLDFPRYGQNIFADTVRAYLDGEFGDPTKISPYLISPHYSGDRKLAAPMIREGIHEGVVFVTNRYTSASAGHQGAKIEDPIKRAEFLEWLRSMEYSQKGFNIPRPDITILLDIPSEVSRELIVNRTIKSGTTIDGHESNSDYNAKVVEVFREIAAKDPTWRTINCLDESGKILQPNIISEKIWETVKPYLPPRFSYR